MSSAVVLRRTLGTEIDEVCLEQGPRVMELADGSFEIRIRRGRQQISIGSFRTRARAEEELHCALEKGDITDE